MIVHSREFFFNALIIDSDEKLSGAFSGNVLAKKVSADSHVHYLFAKNRKEVSILLENDQQMIHWVFLNPATYGVSTVPMIEQIHRRRPVTPIYFFYDHQLPFSVVDLPRLAVHSSIQKPLVQNLVSILAAKIFEKTPTQYLHDLSITTRAPSVGVVESDYLGVHVSDLMGGLNLFMDLYVQQPDATYLKIVEPKDNFTFDQIRIHLDRGVRQFYIKKQSHDRLLKYCEIISKSILTKVDLGAEVKVIEICNFGQKLIDQVKTEKLSEDHINDACQYGNHIRSVLPKLQENDGQLFKALLYNAHAYDHAVVITVMAFLMSKALQIDSEVILKSVSLATFFHNLGLYKMSAELQNTPESAMSPEQRLVYETHPRVGAEILSQLGTLDETVIQAVTQHHERRDHSGFPHKIGGSRINRIAEIIGIADEYLQLQKDKRGYALINVPFNVEEELVKRIFPKFSFPVVEAFRTVISMPKS
jgi:HD-GYP domain-containing protein (c-di-GMP phosphodiesterase class II)